MSGYELERARADKRARLRPGTARTLTVRVAPSSSSETTLRVEILERDHADVIVSDHAGLYRIPLDAIVAIGIRTYR